MISARGKRPGLCIDLFFDFGDDLGGKVDREEDDLGIDAVFGLERRSAATNAGLAVSSAIT
jgi:hypothetical protein